MTRQEWKERYLSELEDDPHDVSRINLGRPEKIPDFETPEEKVDRIYGKATEELEDVRKRLHSRANGRDESHLTRRDPPISLPTNPNATPMTETNTTAMSKSKATKVASSAIPELLSAISDEAGRNVDARRILNCLSESFFDRDFYFERRKYDIFIETFLTKEELAVQGIRSETGAKLTFKVSLSGGAKSASVVTILLPLSREIKLEIPKWTKLWSYMHWLGLRYYNWSESGVTDFENYMEDRPSFETENKAAEKLAKKSAVKENAIGIAITGAALFAVVFCGIKWGLIAGFGAAFGIFVLLFFTGLLLAS